MPQAYIYTVTVYMIEGRGECALYVLYLYLLQKAVCSIYTEPVCVTGGNGYCDLQSAILQSAAINVWDH